MKKSAKVFFVPLFACALLAGYGCTDSDAKCESLDTRCHKDVLQVCLSGAWEDAGCPEAKPICHAGECFTAQCSETDAPRCQDAQTRQVCQNGVWINGTCSGTTPICQDGSCIGGQGQACAAADAPRCQNAQTRQVCQDGIWVNTACSGATPVCDKGNCVSGQTGACTDGQTRCGDDKSVQMCLDGGWATFSCTKDKPICDNGVCLAGKQGGSCTDTTDRCKDTTTKLSCMDGRWVETNCPSEIPVCLATGICSAALPDGVCVTPGEVQCTNHNTYRECRGTTWTSAPCPEARPFCVSDRCMGSPWCTTGDKRCKDDGTSQVCVNDSWVDEPCGLDYTCTRDMCVCNDDATRCLGEMVQLCVDGMWVDQHLCTGWNVCQIATRSGLVGYSSMGTGCDHPCTPAARHCGIRNGRMPEYTLYCNQHQRWEIEEICPTGCFSGGGCRD